MFTSICFVCQSSENRRIGSINTVEGTFIVSAFPSTLWDDGMKGEYKIQEWRCS